MTCKELHEYCEHDPRVAIDPRSDCTEADEHLASCSQCNRFIEDRKELLECMDAMRTSAPTMPPSLDGAVLTKYRRYLSDQSLSAVRGPLRDRISIAGVFSWAGAVAFALIVAYGGMFLFTAVQRGDVELNSKAIDRQPKDAPHAVIPANKEVAAEQEPIHKKAKPVAASAKRATHPSSIVKDNNSFSARFESLMYCDQISCPNTMDVIRVQLPLPVLGVTSNSFRPGVVSADVLVGPDGIARGIRVVK